MAGINQNGQKHPIFIVVPQLIIADRPGFFKKDSKIILRIIIIIVIIIIMKYNRSPK